MSEENFKYRGYARTMRDDHLSMGMREENGV